MFKATMTPEAHARMRIMNWVHVTDPNDPAHPGRWEELSVTDLPVGSAEYDLKPGQSISFWIDAE